MSSRAVRLNGDPEDLLSDIFGCDSVKEEWRLKGLCSGPSGFSDPQNPIRNDYGPQDQQDVERLLANFRGAIDLDRIRAAVAEFGDAPGYRDNSGEIDV